MLEVAVAAVAEAVAGHVDRRAEAPAVEQLGEPGGLGGGQQRRGDGEPAVVELGGQVVPVEGVDARLDSHVGVTRAHAGGVSSGNLPI